MTILLTVLILGAALVFPHSIRADETSSARSHGKHAQQDRSPSEERCGTVRDPSTTVEGVQVETSDMNLFEQFFESILQAKTVLKKDHPQKDILRGYCFREFLIVIRQDLQHPHAAGWVQINFAEQDAARVQQELQRALEQSPVFKLEEAERNKIVRFKLKPDVKRGNRKAIRLEVFGPEGFMVGFNQYQEAGDRTPESPASR